MLLAHTAGSGRNLGRVVDNCLVHNNADGAKVALEFIRGDGLTY